MELIAKTENKTSKKTFIKELNQSISDQSSELTPKRALEFTLQNYNLTSDESFNIFPHLKTQSHDTDEISNGNISHEESFSSLSSLEKITTCKDIPTDHDDIDEKNSIETLESKKLNNGLICDPQYYIPFDKLSLTLGMYKLRNGNPFTNKNYIRLFSTEYQTLFKGNKYIDGDIIDSFSAINQLNWRKVTFVPTFHTAEIFGDRSEKLKNDKWDMYNITTDLSGIIMMPYTYGEHCNLVIANFENATLIHINPMRDGKCERVVNNFKSYLDQCILRMPSTFNKINWKRKDFDHQRPYQMDSFNCGVYVMYFMDSIARNKKLDISFNPNEYRHWLASLLITKSENMSEICEYCFRNWKTKKKAFCYVCNRFVHEGCLREEDSVLFSKEFCCILCKEYLCKKKS